jgi:hypothetical protein
MQTNNFAETININNFIVRFSDNSNENKNIRIVDIYGMERKVLQTDNFVETLDISDLPSGLYTVNVRKGDAIDAQQLRIIR